MNLACNERLISAVRKIFSRVITQRVADCSKNKKKETGKLKTNIYKNVKKNKGTMR